MNIRNKVFISFVFSSTIQQVERLHDLPNIGKTVEKKLIEVGIETPEQLLEIGAEQAFIRLATVDEGACLSMLCGLEGAIQGIRWHNLDKNRKEELKEFLRLKRI